MPFRDILKHAVQQKDFTLVIVLGLAAENGVAHDPSRQNHPHLQIDGGPFGAGQVEGVRDHSPVLRRQPLKKLLIDGGPLRIATADARHLFRTGKDAALTVKSPVANMGDLLGLHQPLLIGLDLLRRLQHPLADDEEHDQQHGDQQRDKNGDQPVPGNGFVPVGRIDVNPQRGNNLMGVRIADGCKTGNKRTPFILVGAGGYALAIREQLKQGCRRFQVFHPRLRMQLVIQGKGIGDKNHFAIPQEHGVKQADVRRDVAKGQQPLAQPQIVWLAGVFRNSTQTLKTPGIQGLRANLRLLADFLFDVHRGIEADLLDGNPGDGQHHGDDDGEAASIRRGRSLLEPQKGIEAAGGVPHEPGDGKPVAQMILPDCRRQQRGQAGPRQLDREMGRLQKRLLINQKIEQKWLGRNPLEGGQGHRHRIARHGQRADPQRLPAVGDLPGGRCQNQRRPQAAGQARRITAGGARSASAKEKAQRHARQQQQMNPPARSPAVQRNPAGPAKFHQEDKRQQQHAQPDGGKQIAIPQAQRQHVQPLIDSVHQAKQPQPLPWQRINLLADGEANRPEHDKGKAVDKEDIIHLRLKEG